MEKMKQIPLEKLADDPANIRPEPDINPAFIESIEKQGVIHPIVVRSLEGGKYGVVAGKRRYYAAQKVDGIDEVKCEVREDLEGDFVSARACSLAENTDRLDVSPGRIEEVVTELVEEVVGDFSSLREAARKLKEKTNISMSESTIMQYTQISKLPGHMKTRLKKPSERSDSEKKQLESVLPVTPQGEEEGKKELDTEKQVPQKVLYRLSQDDWFNDLAEENPTKAHEIATEATERGRDKVERVLEDVKRELKGSEEEKQARNHGSHKVQLKITLGPNELEGLDKMVEDKSSNMIKNRSIAAAIAVRKYLASNGLIGVSKKI